MDKFLEKFIKKHLLNFITKKSNIQEIRRFYFRGIPIAFHFRGVLRFHCVSHFHGLPFPWRFRGPHSRMTEPKAISLLFFRLKSRIDSPSKLIFIFSPILYKIPPKTTEVIRYWPTFIFIVVSMPVGIVL